MVNLLFAMAKMTPPCTALFSVKELVEISIVDEESSRMHPP